jgi:hypothetical protein
MGQYLTATEFRNVTNLQSAEYSDTQLNQMLLAATSEIDKRTGRTWQGSQTVTNEYYDGDGSGELWLNHTDIGTISSLSVDEDYNGTFVSVTTSHVIVYAKQGRIVLDTARYSAIAVESFTKGNNTVKITYTYGNASPDDFVKNLCAMIVMQQLRPEQNLEEMIDRRISLLRADSISDI